MIIMTMCYAVRTRISRHYNTCTGCLKIGHGQDGANSMTTDPNRALQDARDALTMAEIRQAAANTPDTRQAVHEAQRAVIAAMKTIREAGR